MSKLYGIPTLELVADMAAPSADFSEEDVRNALTEISMDEIRDMLESMSRCRKVLRLYMDMSPTLNHGGM